jgi:hypothetical protein
MIETAGSFRMLRNLIAVALVAFTTSSAAEANPLDVYLEPYPVLLAGMLNASYIASTGSLVINGKTKTLDTGSGQTAYSNNPFQVTATIIGGTALSAQLTIGTGGTLLSSSSLLQFGFDPVAGGAIEFLFALPTGSLVSDGTFPNKPVDVLFRGLTFPGTWTSSWSSTNFAAMAEIKSDPPAPVPEPSTALLLISGLGMAIGTRRRLRGAR